MTTTSSSLFELMTLGIGAASLIGVAVLVHFLIYVRQLALSDVGGAARRLGRPFSFRKAMPSNQPGGDGDHGMSDLCAVRDRYHSGAGSATPQWPRQRADGPALD